MLLTETDQSITMPAGHELSFSKKAAALTLPRDLSAQIPCYTGQNAIIYKIESGGDAFALKLLHGADSDAMESRDACARFINAAGGDWKTPFVVVPGHLSGGSASYPALLSEWADGDPLYAYLDTIIDDRKAITALQQALVALSAALEEADCSHGDLNLHHIIVSGKAQAPLLKLVDYETAFIPAFEGRLSPGAGTAGLQHPKKLATHYAAHGDRFSFWVLLTAVEALKLLPALWKEREIRAPRHLLFTLADLARPAESAFIQQLKSYHAPALDFYLSQLEQWCRERRPERIDPPRTFSEAEIPYIPREKPQVTEQKKLPVEKEAILDFYADHTTVRKGSKVTLYWNVKGGSPHITGLGPVKSSRGSRLITAERSTLITCTVGSVQKSIQLTVMPIANSPKEKNAPLLKKRALPLKKFSWPLLAAAAAFVLYFSLRGTSGGGNLQTASLAAVPAANEAPAFTEDNIKNFLGALYAAYNAKDLKGIMEHYAPAVEQYYETASLQSDSLEKIIRPLFIQTALYSCTPDFKTLQVSRDGRGAIVHITIEEKVQNGRGDKVETFRTPVVYRLDESFRIVSEKSGDS